MEMLQAELRDLQDVGFDLDLLGFGTEFMDDLLADPESARDPDEAPPVPRVPISVEGDIWILGQHRVVWVKHSPANLQALMQGILRMPAGPIRL